MIQKVRCCCCFFPLAGGLLLATALTVRLLFS